MDRYIEIAPSATPPAAPVANPGYPTNGNPGASLSASELGEWWFHMMTESMRNVLIAAGVIPNHADPTLFLQALEALYSPVGYAMLNATQTFTKGQSGSVPALPATTGTLIFDFSQANNFSGQVTGNATFGNGYTGPGAGKAEWFCIRVQQDAATLRNWAFASNWKYVGGSSSIPGQTQTLSAWDEIIGQVVSDGTISFFVRSDVK